MKRINSKKDLPKEFDLNKYNYLHDFSDKDLFRQLFWRMHFDDAVQSLGSYFLELGPLTKIPYYLPDPFGEVESNPSVNKTQESIGELLRLSIDGSIRPLMRYELQILSGLSDTHGERVGKPVFLCQDEMFGDSYFDKEYRGMIMGRMTDSLNLILDWEDLLLSIDLSTPDEILVDAFRKMLPRWRKELGIVNNTLEIKNSWPVIRNKIIDYKILQYMDLMAWAKGSNIVIPNGVLAVALFPDGERDGFSMVQTIKPFVEKLVKEDSLEKIRREIYK